MSGGADHIDRIMAVMTEAFDPAYGEAWTRRQVEDSLLLGNCYSAVIAADGSDCQSEQPAAAFFMSRFGFDEEELLLLAVSPKYRRLGLASNLLGKFKREAQSRGARRVLLEMRSDNPAEHLYRRSGFQPIGMRPNYYHTPAGIRLDAITFACDLGSAGQI